MSNGLAVRLREHGIGASASNCGLWRRSWCLRRWGSCRCRWWLAELQEITLDYRLTVLDMIIIIARQHQQV